MNIKSNSATFPERSFELRLADAWSPQDWCNTHVVLAVSGGADSVALLRAVAAIKAQCGGAGRVLVAHLNHALRGESADADSAWLAGLCAELKLSFETATADVAALAAAHGDGLEAAGRHARYQFLQQTAERLGARYVATAHTADDQVETVLHHIVRGTGLAGLAGISKRRAISGSVTLVRPLLSHWRREVISYLGELGQAYRTDVSNDDPQFTRNRIRHELLPFVREHFNGDVDGALVRLAAQAGDAQRLVESLAEQLANASVTGVGEASAHVQIDCAQVSSQPPVIVREVCRIAWKKAGWPVQAMGYDEWQMLASLARGEATRRVANLPGNVQARRHGATLTLARL